MRDHRTQATRPRFLRTTLSQLLVVLLVTPTAYFAAGSASAVSFFSGAACAIVPQLFFALRLERAARQSAARAARLSMAAEAGKFVLSAACFAAVFAVLQPTEPVLVFVGFIAMWLLQLWEAARLVRQPQR